MTTLHGDFETQGRIDLPKKGLDNYVKDPFTKPICFGFGFDDEPVDLFAFDRRSTPAIDRVLTHVANGGEFVAHNAPFELGIWNEQCVPRYGWPILRPEQCRCTMAQAYAMALPGSLEKAAAALGIENQKDMAGSRIMLQLARPKYDGTLYTYEEAPEKFEALYAYCRKDVEVERELDHRMMHLSDEEQRMWLLDYKINQRGVQIDLRSVEKALRLVEAEKKRLDAAMLDITGGVVGRCSEVQLLCQWIRSKGVDIGGLSKSEVLDALGGDLPRDVRLALALRKEAAKTSTAKFIAMQQRASADGRVRGSLQFHGASTGRWAGRGLNTQNVPRPRPGMKQKHIDDIFTHLDQRDYLDVQYGPVMDALTDCIRGMICAPAGKDFVAMDFSNIESRVLAWLAGADWKLQVFRDYDAGIGPDIYLVAISWVYGGEPSSLMPHRQKGKAVELGYGFGGGAGAAFTMAKTYGVDLNAMYETVARLADSDALASAENMWSLRKGNYPEGQHDAFIAGDILKQFYRARNPEIVRYWADLEQAAIDAVQLGVVTKAGAVGREITFKKAGSFLWCRLPSGRVLCYPYPSIKTKPTPWGGEKPVFHYYAVNATSNKWEETTGYGGLLAENVTQGLSACLLRNAIVRLEEANFPVVFHAHDEIVAEIATDRPGDPLKEVEHIMSTAPSWAAGLPLAAEGWRGKRYRK